jgi:energy-coupling factor transport system substrate-specific component
VVSLADKIISGFVALAIIEALPADLTKGLRLPGPTSTARLTIAVIGVVVGALLVAGYVMLTPPAAPAA